MTWTGERSGCRCAARSRAAPITIPCRAASGRRSCATSARFRPPRPERALFLTLNAPIRPITRDTIGHVVRRRVARIGIVGKRRGPHALRHGTAQYLLDPWPVDEGGGLNYLGHRSVSATAVYARVQLDTLREVGEIDLEGLL